MGLSRSAALVVSLVVVAAGCSHSVDGKPVANARDVVWMHDHSRPHTDSTPAGTACTNFADGAVQIGRAIEDFTQAYDASHDYDLLVDSRASTLTRTIDKWVGAVKLSGIGDKALVSALSSWRDAAGKLRDAVSHQARDDEFRPLIDKLSTAKANATTACASY